MNKRLKQLGDQAGVCPIKHVGGGEWDSYLPEAEQKFAELIVKECLNNMENCDGDLDFAIWKTKQDFGMKS